TDPHTHTGVAGTPPIDHSAAGYDAATRLVASQLIYAVVNQMAEHRLQHFLQSMRIALSAALYRSALTVSAVGSEAEAEIEAQNQAADGVVTGNAKEKRIVPSFRVNIGTLQSILTADTQAVGSGVRELMFILTLP